MRLGRSESRRASGPYLILAVTVGALLSGGGVGAVQAQATPAGAQATARLSGTVVDVQTLAPVPTARVILVHPASQAHVAVAESDSAGAFDLPPAPHGAYLFRVERIGYKPLLDTVSLPVHEGEDLTVRMVPEALDLEPLVVRVARTTAYYMRDFETRRVSGSGMFITRDQIERRRARSTSELLQSLGGVRVVYGTRGEAGLFVRGTCRPNVYIDGVAIHQAVSIDMAAVPDDIEGIEVHSMATIPPQYAQFSSCAAILVWTRPAVRGESRKVAKWKVLMAGSIGLVVWLLLR
ncbi:MAG TPA: carboxypeptidase regulatory-like domain-containing protein [Longimicrobiales bacterium]|nr:carboxypeptidase regulatory-like domain-containing protein [Longimicrobiales bacterium]